MNKPTSDPVAEAKERVRKGTVPHKVVLTIRQTPAGIKVECQPPFHKLQAIVEAKTAAPVEAYAWVALSAMRTASAKITAEAKQRRSSDAHGLADPFTAS